MLSVETRGKILVMKLIGELEAEHLQEKNELVEEKLAEQEDPRLMVDLRRYEGAHDLPTAWQELKLVTSHAKSVKKIAVIGSLDWQKLATLLVSPFTRAKEQFFEPDEIDAAFEWLRE